LLTTGARAARVFGLPALRFGCTLNRDRSHSAAFLALHPSRRSGVSILELEVLMNLTISGHHLEVTPALREYVLTKLDRVTRHFDQVVDVTVLLTVEKMKEKERRQRAEVTLHVKGRDIFIEQADEDLYAAIDQLMDKLDRQVMRHKDRLQDHHHVSPKRGAANVV
jgi:putative sigma-54 modulation protein